MVKPKKHLGQHFLRDLSAAERIAAALTSHGDYSKIIEIGPGTGVLTQYLLQRKEFETWVAEIDTESVDYLKVHFPQLQDRLLEGDFLRMDLEAKLGERFAVIGNFPYNISSQILFKVYDHRDKVPEVVGMFQKDVAERVCAGPGSKTYGILSVLLQAFYTCEYLFTVEPEAFNPPPKVRSGVIRLKRNEVDKLPCDEARFFQIVKMGFNQRRKTLRNSLSRMDGIAQIDKSGEIWGKRPEQLSVEEFVQLTLQFQT